MSAHEPTVTASDQIWTSLVRCLGLLLLLCASAWVEAKPHTIGFAQSDTSESNWRRANTESFREAARVMGIDLVFKDAGGNTGVQRRQVQELIDQKVDAIVLSANEIGGWDGVLLNAKKAKIPVILSDRTIALQPENQGKSLFVTWIGSDFRYEGRAAAAWLAQETAGRCNIVEIQGPAGAAPSIDRGKGFRDVIALFPGMKVIAAQRGNWRTDQAKDLMKVLLRNEGANICAVFAHNDNMAIGAVQAIEDSKHLGLTPGKDILIIGVDAVRQGFEYLIDKKINALVECNPLLGRIVLKVALEILGGRSFPPTIFMEDRVFTVDSAPRALASRKY
ncbi:MAG: ABC transporter substrate-binding protein [Sphaerotilus sp.]|nr:ABC transporter substrate-binding protein [Sphaerotilus sp.]